MGAPRVILVSNRLPLSIIEENGKLTSKRSAGGLATAMSSIAKRQDAIWIGWPGTRQPLETSQLRSLGFPKELVPVMPSEDQLGRYYDRVANGVLWPIMHGISPAGLRTVTDEDWRTMEEVTGQFAAAVQAQLRPEDIIWIHDYHLSFLPRQLRAAGVRNRIGFFLHTPFPGADFLLAQPLHRQLLKSLTQVDVFGLQTERDVAHFRTSLAAAGMRMGRGGVVKAFPIGVDFKAYHTADRLGMVKSHLARLRAKLGGRRVILSVSRLDYTKGIIEQLYAVQQLLERLKHPERLVYKLIVSPSREDVEEYRHLKRDIEETVAAINARFARKGFRPIAYAYRNHGFEEVNAWFRLAHILLVTPRIDGMNLVAKEYIAARENGQGMIVLSETAGAAFQLKDAVLVDPLDIDGIAKGLYQALRMPSTERKRRWRSMRRTAKAQDVFWWADHFLRELNPPGA